MWEEAARGCCLIPFLPVSTPPAAYVKTHQRGSRLDIILLAPRSTATDFACSIESATEPFTDDAGSMKSASSSALFRFKDLKA